MLANYTVAIKITLYSAMHCWPDVPNIAKTYTKHTHYHQLSDGVDDYNKTTDPVLFSVFGPSKRGVFKFIHLQ